MSWPNDQGTLQARELAVVIKDYVKAIVRKRPAPVEKSDKPSFVYEELDLAGGDYNIDDLINVSIVTPLNNDVMTYETATALWKNKPGGTTTVVPGTVRINASVGDALRLSGAINGVNTTFTTTDAVYVTGTLSVWLNGVLQTRGASNDWVETTPGSGTFDFVVPPTDAGAVPDVVSVEYTKTGAAPYQIDCTEGDADLLSTTVAGGVYLTATVSKGNYVSGTLQLFQNGALLTRGATGDWTEDTPASGTTTFVSSISDTEIITAKYQYT